jgi:opacity protein-like surface antigen
MKLLKIISTNVLLLAGIASSAQEAKTIQTDSSFNKLGFGIKGGMNYATVTKGDFDEGPDARTSFYVGAIAEIPIIDDSFSIQPEVLYSRQGFERNYSLLGEDYKSAYQIDYINVPVLAKLYIVKGFSVEAGPQFGFKINEKIDLDTANDEEGNNLDEINDFDMSLAAGITFKFDSGLFVNGRYNHSFNEIIKDSDAKNLVLQFGLGYKF